MKAILLLALVVVAFAHDGLNTQFRDFMMKYNKHYEGVEFMRRLHIFKNNLELAKQRMEENPIATHGITKFMDLTPEEFEAQVLMPPVAGADLAVACLRQGVYAPHIAKDAMTHPDALDWRQTPNIVLAVEDQGSCGSCWAFSTAQNIEGQNGMAHNDMAGIQLSPQYIVDCSKGCSSEIYNNANTTVCNGGCNGGWPWTAFNDIATTAIAGVPAASTYPYKGTSGTCKVPTAPLSVIRSYQCIGLDSTNNEDEMADYLYTLGPLSIALNANPFQTYTGGIIEPIACSTKALNHAVLLVGYGTDTTSNTPYWIIKNSWGSSWGESGYCRLLRGKGTCGVNEAVSCSAL